jgi:hypothetical protein
MTEGVKDKENVTAPATHARARILLVTRRWVRLISGRLVPSLARLQAGSDRDTRAPIVHRRAQCHPDGNASAHASTGNLSPLAIS